MHSSLTDGQRSILHSLLDGDDPLLRAPDAELIYFTRDLQHLAALGLIELDGRRCALSATAWRSPDPRH